MNYIEVTLKPDPMSEEVCDVLAALLAPLGFDSFSTEQDCLKAYVTENLWDADALESLLSALPIEGVNVSWSQSVVEMQDWNQEWEQSQQFDPILVGGLDEAGGVRCCVHSPAAPAESIPDCRYEVIIDPKMSFGTGTHETTSQLLEEILNIADGKNLPMSSSAALPSSSAALSSSSAASPSSSAASPSSPAESARFSPSLRALDMGTGTGVLGILCAQLGYEVRAIEIDDWVAANAVDNVLYNGLAGKMKVECGDAALLTEGPAYQLVLANINRNVLINDMARYEQVMLPGATLLMSGFYEEDVPAIRQCAESLGLQYQYHHARNGWTVVRFQKPQQVAGHDYPKPLVSTSAVVSSAPASEVSSKN